MRQEPPFEKLRKAVTDGFAAKTAPLRLSEELGRLAEIFAERSVTLRELVDVIQGRAYTLLLILLSLPFCTPVPLPGVSTLVGSVIALIGFRLALRRKPWLPARLLDASLPPRFFANLLKAAKRLVSFLEWALHPRLAFLVDNGPAQHLYGAVVFISGVLLLLPLPVPFSNILPAFTVLLVSAALLERDGYCAIASLFSFALTLCFFAALAWGGTEGVVHGGYLLDKWFGGD